MKTQHAGIFWKTSGDSMSWAKASVSHFEFVLGQVFDGAVSIELRLPDAETAKKMVAANLDLLGEIVLAWSAVSDKPLRLEIPLPYHGVFVKHREDSGTAGLGVWASWLGELSGFRYVRKPGNSKKVFWRLGLAGAVMFRHGAGSWMTMRGSVPFLNASAFCPLLPRGRSFSALLMT